MKTIKEITSTEPIFLEGFESKIDVISQFYGIYASEYEYHNAETEWELKSRSDIDDLLIGEFKDINIVLASYNTPAYEGYAYVLFEKHGKLYEVNGSHCSCYGLENQWEPEEVDLKELEHRLLNGTFGEEYSGYFKEELCEKLGVEYISNMNKEWN